VAKALEGAVPDIAAARIIDQQMKPAFRSGDFAGGIDAALEQLFARISGEALPEPEMTQEWEHARGGLMDNLGDLSIFAVVLIVVFGQLLRAMLGGKIAALLVGGVSGGLVYWLTASLVMAAGGGLIAAVFILLAKAGGGGGSGY